MWPQAPQVSSAFAPEPETPAGLVLGRVRTHWLLDRPAAAELVVKQERLLHMYG